jgi:hypothetical protein
MGTPDAVAKARDLRSEGKHHAARYDGSWQPPGRQRKHAGRGGAGHRQHRAAGGRRVRVVALRPAPRPAAANPTQEPLPLTERSLVASHPLSADIGVAPRSELVARRMSPRCRSTHASVFELAIESLARGFSFSGPALVEGAWPHCRRASHPQTSWRPAAHGSAARHAPHWAGSAGHAESAINWRASAACLAGPLRAVLDLVAEAFGPLTVNSTCRSPAHNRRVGGATKSYHLTGNAVDFRVRNNYGEVLTFLKKVRTVGGVSHYGAGVFHIDTGPRRTWGPGSWRRQAVGVARRG